MKNNTHWVSYREVFQLAETGLRLGSIPVFAYTLACHVLQAMKARGVRQLSISAQELSGTTLRAADGRLLANDVALLLHSGMSVRRAGEHRDVSPAFVDALQKLHWSGLLQSDPQSYRLDDSGADTRHFTMDPSLRDGVDWTESTQIFYRMPEASLENCVARFVAFCGPSRSTAKVAASFL